MSRRDPPDLRCRLSRHLPIRRPSRLPDWTASPGVVQRSPLRRTDNTGVHSRLALAGPPSERAGQGSFMFRPRGFPPPRRVAPPMLRACVATRSDPGVHLVSEPFPQVALQNRHLSKVHFPALRSLPSVRSRNRSSFRSTRT